MKREINVMSVVMENPPATLPVYMNQHVLDFMEYGLNVTGCTPIVR